MTAPAETPTSATQYTHLIYAAALRQTKDPHLAADITQAVFLVLLKKSNSGKAPEEHHMTGWLLQVTRYIIKETRRASFRRHRRELSTPTPTSSSPTPHPDILDLLDTALLTLNPLDRELIARRYLHEEPIDSLAATLDLSPNTTTKRITRALEKLRTALTNQGITSPTAAITTTLATQATIHSPTTTATPLAHHLAHRVLLHSLLAKAAVVTAIALAFCGITTLTVIIAFHTSTPTTPTATTPPAPSAAATTPASENLIHLGKILEPPSDQLLAQTLAGIQDCQSKFKNLQLDATYTMYSPDLAKDGVSPDSQTTGTGWIDATGHFRAEISTRRTPWTNGAAPSYEDSFTEVWDGSNVRLLHTPPHSSPRGEVLDLESFSTGRTLFGRMFSTQLPQDLGVTNNHTEIRENPLSQKNLATFHLSASRVILNGHEAIQLETRFKLSDSLDEESRQYLEKESRTWWFDPSRGHALLAYQEALDGEHLVEQRAIDELTEAAPGVFYPTHAKAIQYVRQPNSHTWTLFYTAEFRATKVLANQPLDPTFFRLEFPQGIPISDAASSQPATQR